MSGSVSNSTVAVPSGSGTEFLQAAAHDCPHGLMIETGGRVVYANPAYARLAGVTSPGLVIGEAVSELSVPAASIIKSSSQGNGGPEFETVRVQFRRNGRTFGVSVVRDVSERKRLQNRLRESEKMEALGRLVGGVAHDFNNVLTAIALYSELLLERSPRRREAEEIHLAAQRGISLVRQLLTFARQQPAAPRRVSVRAIVTAMRGMLEPLLGEKIKLRSRFHCAHDTVNVDPAQMQQVILNLVMNARDAMPEGGEVRISTALSTLNGRSPQRQPGVRPGRYVNLTVTDTGCGMDENARARIFEPFFTTKGEGQGVGLGMAMVHSIVTGSGGALLVTSKPGKGTRINILLPLCSAPDECGEAALAIGRMPAGSETILLVEDDHAVRASIAHLLTEAGYHVLQAPNGDHAIGLARSHGSHIDLLIADVVMPGMSGNDVAQHLQKLHPETRTLFMTGYPADACRAASAGPILYKPFSRAVLAEKVRELLDHRSPLPPSAGAHRKGNYHDLHHGRNRRISRDSRRQPAHAADR